MWYVKSAMQDLLITSSSITIAYTMRMSWYNNTKQIYGNGIHIKVLTTFFLLSYENVCPICESNLISRLWLKPFNQNFFTIIILSNCIYRLKNVVTDNELQYNIWFFLLTTIVAEVKLVIFMVGHCLAVSWSLRGILDHEPTQLCNIFSI